MFSIQMVLLMIVQKLFQYPNDFCQMTFPAARWRLEPASIWYSADYSCHPTIFSWLLNLPKNALVRYSADISRLIWHLADNSLTIFTRQFAPVDLTHLFQSPHLVETQRRIMHDGMSLLSSQFLCAKYGDFKKSYLALPTDRMPAKTSVLKHYVILMHSRFYFDH